MNGIQKLRELGYSVAMFDILARRYRVFTGQGVMYVTEEFLEDTSDRVVKLGLGPPPTEEQIEQYRQNVSDLIRSTLENG